MTRNILLVGLLLNICIAGFSQQRVHVVFDFDKAILTPEARASLDNLLAVTDFRNKRIQLQGHTDSVGSFEYNDALSQRRVNAVAEYLVSAGFPSDNIQAKTAKGKREPLNTNATEAERQANRRVEIEYPNAPERTNVTDIPTSKPGDLTRRMTDTSTRTGTNIILQNLNFYGGRHVLLPQSLPVLEELLAILKANPTMVIEIHGHICCAMGSGEGLDLDTNTFELSVNRARAVYQYLVDNGIDAARLSYKGFGHKHPLVYPEDTEEKRTTNRRVEIKIIKR